MNYLFTVAGRGSRFKQKGIKPPKPLIKVFGNELLIWSMNSFNYNSDDRIFIVTYKFHKDYYEFNISGDDNDKDKVAIRGLILTCAGSERRNGLKLGDTSCSYFNRFFAPNIGIPEDSVTGSAHCALARFWLMNKEYPLINDINLNNNQEFVAIQGTSFIGYGRGGIITIQCKEKDNEKSVIIAGACTTVMRTHILN